MLEDPKPLQHLVNPHVTLPTWHTCSSTIFPCKSIFANISEVKSDGILNPSTELPERNSGLEEFEGFWTFWRILEGCWTHLLMLVNQFS